MFLNQGYIVFIFQCIHSIINVLILHLITFVTVENEGMKENVLTEVSTQINSFIIVASVIFILIYVYPILRTGRRISKLSSVSNQLFQFYSLIMCIIVDI